MAQNDTFYGWKLVAVLWLIYCITAAFPIYGGTVITADMVGKVGFNRSILGLGFSLLMMMGGIPAPLVARAINYKGIRHSIITGTIIIAFACALLATMVKQTATYVMVYGIIMGIGFCYASTLPVQTGITLWFHKKRALAMGIVMSAAGIGGLVAVPLLRKIITTYNWQTAWWFIVGLHVVALVLALLFVKNKPADLGQVPDGTPVNHIAESSSVTEMSAVYKTHKQIEVKDAFRTKAIWLIIIGILGMYIPYLTALGHGIVHLMDQGISPDIAAYSVGIMTVVSIVGRLSAGYFADHIEPRMLMCVSNVMIAIAIVTLLGAKSPTMVYIYAALLGFGFGVGYITIPTIIANYFGSTVFASIMGVVTPWIGIIAGVTPFIAGILYDRTGTYGFPFLVVAVCALIGGIAVLCSLPVETVSSVTEIREDEAS